MRKKTKKLVDKTWLPFCKTALFVCHFQHQRVELAFRSSTAAQKFHGYFLYGLSRDFFLWLNGSSALLHYPYYSPSSHAPKICQQAQESLIRRQMVCRLRWHRPWTCPRMGPLQRADHRSPWSPAEWLRQQRRCRASLVLVCLLDPRPRRRTPTTCPPLHHLCRRTTCSNSWRMQTPRS